MTIDTANNSRIYLDCDMREADVTPLARGSASVVSIRCPGKQTPNEDAAALIPVGEDSAVIVVADGLGGLAAGDIAARVAIDQVRAATEAAVTNGELLRTAIINGFENANRAVQDMGIGAATTLAVVEVQGTTIRPYHVGDSMILVVGQRGRLKMQSISHSPVGYLVEAGVLNEAEAMHHEDRHLVSNVIGIPDMRIDIGSTIEMAARDTLLLASDGLMDNLHVFEVIECIRKGPLPAAMHQLAAQSHERMTHKAEGLPSKPDDMTVALFRMN